MDGTFAMKELLIVSDTWPAKLSELVEFTIRLEKPLPARLSTPNKTLPAGIWGPSVSWRAGTWVAKLRTAREEATASAVSCTRNRVSPEKISGELATVICSVAPAASAAPG